MATKNRGDFNVRSDAIQGPFPPSTRTMKRRHADRAGAVMLLAALAAGCGLLPERYSPEQIARVGSDLTSTDSIYAEFGPPDLRRDDARLWIYAWRSPEQFTSLSLVALEFDTDERLSHREIALGAKPIQGGPAGFQSRARYCTEGGICVEHAIATDAGIRFDDSFSAVTVRGAAQARVRPSEPATNECQLVIWPGEGWSQSRSRIPPPDGVAVSIGGASKWSYYRWLPVGAYARIVLPAGEHGLSVRDPAWDERISHETTSPEDEETPHHHSDLEWKLSVLDVLLGPATPPEESDRKPQAATFHCRAGNGLTSRSTQPSRAKASTGSRSSCAPWKPLRRRH